MGTKKNARRRERTPWETVVIRTRKGVVLHIGCPRCKKRTALRYWDPDAHQGICASCVPAGVQLPRQRDSDPDHRPLALS